MIVSNSNSALDHLPFQPVVDRKNREVRFLDGFVVDCYNNQKDETSDFSNGCLYKKPKNIDQSFSYESGDEFFLKIEKKIEDSEIIKIKSQGIESKQGRLIKIWAAPDRDGLGEQVLSENVFLQDLDGNKKYSFSLQKIGELNGKTNYKINGGYVLIPEIGESVYLEDFHFLAKEEDLDKIFHFIKIELSAELADPDPIDNANLSYAKNIKLGSVKIVSSEENIQSKPIRISEEEDSEKGVYYIKLPRQGNILINPLSIIIDRVYITAGILTQVKGVKFFKNGVSTGLITGLIEPINQDERGFYDTIAITTKYPKYEVVVDPETGEILQANELPDHEVTTTYEVDKETDTGNPNISSTPPEVIVSVEEQEVGESEIVLYTSPLEDQYKLGLEISSDAMQAAKAELKKIEYTPIDLWDGDADVVLLGAGQKGEVKISPTVQYGERRYKHGGIINGTVNLKDEEVLKKISQITYKSYVETLDTDGFSEISGEEINFDEKTASFLSKNWVILEGGEDSYKKDTVPDYCTVYKEFGEYRDLDITKKVLEYYQEISI